MSTSIQLDKNKSFLLVDGYIRSLEALSGRHSPKEINSVCFDFYYLDFIMDSEILTEDERVKLREFFVENDYDIGAEWKLLYRGSEHEFDCKLWNKVCINKKNVITIVHSDNECVFGGFAVEGWVKNSKNHHLSYKKDERAFLCLLRSAKSEAAIFPIKSSKADYATVVEDNHMACFGENGLDMVITDKCNHGTKSKSWVGWKNTTRSYETPSDNHLNDGQQYFNVHELETFMNVKDEV